jgi:hypothetical protein
MGILMGNFYVNYTLRGADQDAVALAMAGRLAIVSREQAGCVVVFDQESDTQNPEVILRLTAQLASELHCPVWTVLNHDDDILWYQLYMNGSQVDEYNSAPDYFSGLPLDQRSGPKGGDAALLCRVFASSRVAEVETILRKPSREDDGYLFAVQRHADLAGALGVPEFVAGAGYGYLAAGELPEGLNETDLIRLE